jgi:hypothetical protein
MNRAWAEMEASCHRLGLASRAFYSVKNRGNGPTVHLARELARIWGNLDYGVHELSRDDERGMSEIRAYAWDQQTNVRSSRTFQVPHRRMGGGAKLTDLTDIYLNNQNIGARAVRECILSALPADFVEDAKGALREDDREGRRQPLTKRITDMASAFKSAYGVTVRRSRAPRPQARAVDGRRRRRPGVVFRTIERHETTVDEEFPPERVTAATVEAHRGVLRVRHPDGACNLSAGHDTGPDLDGFDGHDVVPLEKP